MFEYKVLNVSYSDEGLEDELNELGKNGWELVVSIPETGGSDLYVFTLILKRKKG